MLEGIIRDSIEKKATKALRRDGYLIANIYGKGEENINAAFKANEFIKAAKNKENLIFPVKVAGNEYNVVIQDYQRDPVNNNLLHVDLRIALPGVLSKYLVPVVLEGGTQWLTGCPNPPNMAFRYEIPYAISSHLKMIQPITTKNMV